MSERHAVELRIWAWTDADCLADAIADTLLGLGFNHNQHGGPVAAVGTFSQSDELDAWQSSPEEFLDAVRGQVDYLTIPNGAE